MTESKDPGCGCFFWILFFIAAAFATHRIYGLYTNKLAVWTEDVLDIGVLAHYKDRHVEFCKKCDEMSDSDGRYGYICHECVPFVPLPDDPDTGIFGEDNNPTVSITPTDDGGVHIIHLDGEVKKCSDCNQDSAGGNFECDDCVSVEGPFDNN